MLTSNIHDGWLLMEDLPQPRLGECVHIQVLLSKALLGCRIHTARYSLTSNEQVMILIAGVFAYDLGKDNYPIRFKFLSEIPEGL